MLSRRQGVFDKAYYDAARRRRNKIRCVSSENPARCIAKIEKFQRNFIRGMQKKTAHNPKVKKGFAASLKKAAAADLETRKHEHGQSRDQPQPVQ